MVQQYIRSSLGILMIVGSLYSSSFAQWQRVDDTPLDNVWWLSVVDSTILVSTYDDGIFLSTHSGLGLRRVGEWFNIQFYVHVLKTSDSHIRLLTHELSGHLNYSDDTGRTWQDLYPPYGVASHVGEIRLINGKTRLFVSSMQNLRMDSLYASDDFGLTWHVSSQGFAKGSVAESFTVANGVLFCAGYNIFSHGPGEIYKSTDDGSSWEIVKTAYDVNNKIVAVKKGVTFDYLFTTTWTNGILRSTDLGASWKPVNKGLPPTGVVDLATKGDLLIAAIQSGGIYVSKDDGESWELAGQGITDLTGNSIGVNDEFVFYGGKNSGLWRRPLAEFYSLDVAPTMTRTDVRIYPNPAQEEIAIEYDWNRTGDLSITVYSLDGVRVLDKHIAAHDGRVQLTTKNWTTGRYNIVLRSDRDEVRTSFVKR